MRNRQFIFDIDRKLVKLSSQQIIDCSWGSVGNHGCKGGHYAAALSWIFTHGISTDKSYGKYLGQVSNFIKTNTDTIEISIFFIGRYYKYLFSFLHFTKATKRKKS